MSIRDGKDHGRKKGDDKKVCNNGNENDNSSKKILSAATSRTDET